MLLSVITSQLASNPSTGGILKDSNNGLITSLSNILSANDGLLIIKGSGYVQGSSNPSNTSPDVLSLNVTRPSIDSGADTVFSKVFTSALTTFFFEIQMGWPSALSAGNPFVKVCFQDGTVITKLLGINIQPISFYEIALNHTTASGLYSIVVVNVLAEYQSAY